MKAILLMWIGLGNSAQLAVDHFDTVAECQSAANALLAHDRRLDPKCIPYSGDPRSDVQVPQAR